MVCSTYTNTVFSSFLKGLTSGGGINDVMKGGSYLIGSDAEETVPTN
jgi:hypothetical protein